MAIRDLVPWARPTDRTPVERQEESGHPLMSLHRDVNRLFDDVFRGFGMPAIHNGFGRGVDWPSVEVNETDKEIRVAAELPGLTEKDVEVTIDDGVLTLRGERKAETEDKERGYSECYYGRFERQIGLPRGGERDKARATFKNGLLNIALPKSQAAIESTRRIPIHTN